MKPFTGKLDSPAASGLQPFDGELDPPELKPFGGRLDSETFTGREVEEPGLLGALKHVARMPGSKAPIVDYGDAPGNFEHISPQESSANALVAQARQQAERVAAVQMPWPEIEQRDFTQRPPRANAAPMSRPVIEPPSLGEKAAELHRRDLEGGNTIAGRINDAFVAAGQGLGSIAASPAKLFNPDGEAAQRALVTQRAAAGAKSPMMRAKHARAEERVKFAAANGLWPELKAAAEEYAGDPDLAADLIFTTMPSMIGVLGPAKVAQYISILRGGTGKAAGLGAATVANATMTGGDARSQAFEDLREVLLKQGVEKTEATRIAKRESLAPAAAGVITGGLGGRYGAEAAGFLGGAAGKSALRRAGGAFLGETATEFPEELLPQIVTNDLARQLGDPDRDLLSGIPTTAVQTAVGISGPATLGAVGAARQGTEKDQATRELADLFESDLSPTKLRELEAKRESGMAGAMNRSVESVAVAPPRPAIEPPMAAGGTGTPPAGGAPQSPAQQSAGMPLSAVFQQAGETGAEWVGFPPQAGGMGVPRAEMPQVKGSDRPALRQFLAEQGINSEEVELPATAMRPTQAEFSPAKAEKWKEARDGADRTVLVSADGYILDGHHQWVAAIATGQPVKAMRFGAKINDLLDATNRFPLATRGEGATGQLGDFSTAMRRISDSLGLPIGEVAQKGAPKEPVSLHDSLRDSGHRVASTGKLFGAPPSMKTDADYAALQSRLVKLADEGKAGRMWYEKSGRAVLDIAEGDKSKAEKIVGLLAIYSPQQTVSGNTTLALKAYAEYQNTGKITTISNMGQAVATKAQQWMDGTLGQDQVTGVKRSNFYRNLMREIDPESMGADAQGVTVDMHIARAGGYGSKISSGKNVEASGQYQFMEREIKKVAASFGWEPQQAQAAVWGAIKARVDEVLPAVRDESVRRGWLVMDDSRLNRYGKPMVTYKPPSAEGEAQYEAMLLEEGMKVPTPPHTPYDFGDAIRERMAQVSWEARPGRSTNVLPGIHTAPLGQQLEYLMAVDAAMRDENGQDAIATKIGLAGSSTFFGPSAWQGEVAHGAQTETALALDRPKQNLLEAHPDARSLINLYSAIRGLVMSQEAVVWHYPNYASTIKAANGVDLDFGRMLTGEEVERLYSAISEVAGHTEWAPAVTRNGVRVLNFTDTPNPAFHAAVRQALGNLPAAFDGVGFKRFGAIGDYIGNDWTESPNGEGYRQRIGEAGRPDLLQWVEDLARKVAEVNQDFASRYGWDKAQGLPAQEVAVAGGPSVRKLSPDEFVSPGLMEQVGELLARAPKIEEDKLSDEDQRRAEDLLAPVAAAADRNKPDYDRKLQEIANEVGGLAVMAPNKSAGRSAVKLVRENNWDVGSMKDLLRGSILVKDEEAARATVEAIGRHHEINRVKDRFKQPTPAGYSDFLVNVTMPDGSFAEIQVMTPEMFSVKDMGHKLYEVTRTGKAPKMWELRAALLSKLLYGEAKTAVSLANSSADTGIPLWKALEAGNLRGSGSKAKASSASGDRATGLSSTSSSVQPLATSSSGVTGSSSSPGILAGTKVVDGSGNPLPVFHATSSKFKEFDPAQTGRNNPSYAKRGFFFYKSKRSATERAYEHGNEARVMRRFLNLQNPLVVTARSKRSAEEWFDNNAESLYARAEKMGADGIIVKVNPDSSDLTADDIYVAFEPGQIVKPSESGLPVGEVAQGGTDLTSTPEFRRWFGRSKVQDIQRDDAAMRAANPSVPYAVQDAGAKHLEKHVPGAKPRVMYHATDADISVFRPGGAANAIYLATDPDMAADAVTQNKMEKAGKSAASGLAYETGKGAFQPNVSMPVYVRAENPFDFRLRSHADALAAYLEKNDPEAANTDPHYAMDWDGFVEQVSPKRSSIRDKINAGAWWVIERPAAQKFIKENGFDGFYEQEVSMVGSQEVTLAVFSPDQIKSATGNSGAFDPANPDINAQAGAGAGDIYTGIRVSASGKAVPDTSFRPAVSESDMARRAIQPLEGNQPAVIQAALADLTTTMPAEWMQGTTFYGLKPVGKGHAIYDPRDAAIAVDWRLLDDKSPDAQLRIRGYLAHELSHKIDNYKNSATTMHYLSMESPRMDMIVRDGAVHGIGDLAAEAAEIWSAEGELGRYLNYPMMDAIISLSAGGKRDDVIGFAKIELFAQMSALWHTNRALLEKEAPRWAAMFKEWEDARRKAGSNGIAASRAALRGVLQKSNSVPRVAFDRSRGAGLRAAAVSGPSSAGQGGARPGVGGVPTPGGVNRAANAVSGSTPAALIAKGAAFLSSPQATPDMRRLPGHANYDVLLPAQNYGTVNSPDDVKATLAALTRDHEKRINTQRRGSVSHEQTYKEAEALYSDVVGLSRNGVANLLHRKPGTAAGAAELLARRDFALKAADDLQERSKKINAGKATQQELAEFGAAVDRAGMLFSMFMGARAEAGRALNILRETKRLSQSVEQYQEAITAYGGTESLSQLAKIIGTANPAQALAIARLASKPGWFDALVEAWKASLLTGPTTHLTNVVSNTVFAALRIPEQFVAGLFGAVTGGVRIEESVAMAYGMLAGTVEGIKYFGRATLDENYTPMGGNPVMESHQHAIAGETFGIGGKPGAVIDWIGKAVRAPSFRMLSAEDAFFRVMNLQMSIHAGAVRQALKEGRPKWQQGFAHRVAQLINESKMAVLDPQLRVSKEAADIAEESVQAALRYTFQEKMGKIGESINTARRNIPALQFVFPFVRTPINIFRQGVERTPLAWMSKQWREDFKAGGARRDMAMARAVFGTGIQYVVLGMVGAGMMTGGGDPEREQKKRRREAGIPDYSIKVGDKWYEYRRLEPGGVVLGLAADASEIWSYMGQEDRQRIGTMLGMAFAQNVTSKTFMSGLADIVNAVGDPERYGDAYLTRLTGTVVPGAISQTAALRDPVARDTGVYGREKMTPAEQSIQESLNVIKSRLPKTALNPEFNSESLPAKIDSFGQPIKKLDRTFPYSPIRTSSTSDDPVRLEAMRLRVKTGDWSKSAAGVKLNPEERWARAQAGGELAHQVMSQIVTGDGYRAIPDPLKTEVWDKVFAASKKYGTATITPKIIDAMVENQLTKVQKLGAEE